MPNGMQPVMGTLHAIFIAVLQGATELFPVSSLGHAVVVPPLLGLRIDQAAPSFLPFLVMLHVGTAAALMLFFWRDWWALATGVLGLASPHQVAESRRVFLLVIVATIPAVIVGGLFEHALRSLFAAPVIVAGFLVLNGILLIATERLRGSGTRPLSELRVPDALAIGCWQCIALLPGLSRSGATIAGGLLRGINHEGAAHFSFLIAVPVILAATANQAYRLLGAGMPPGTFSTALLAALVAGVVAWLSTLFLMRWFRDNDDWALTPFGWYCIVLGLGAGAWFLFA
jgi:undecaprenyl-diphosphatase